MMARPSAAARRRILSPQLERAADNDRVDPGPGRRIVEVARGRQSAGAGLGKSGERRIETMLAAGEQPPRPAELFEPVAQNQDIHGRALGRSVRHAGEHVDDTAAPEAGLTVPFGGGDNDFPDGAIRARALRLVERNGGFERRGSMSVISIDGAGGFPASARGAIVTVGNFDGVHLGHQQLLGRRAHRADAAGVPALAITFDPHPVALLRPEAAPVPLSGRSAKSPCSGRPAPPKSRVFRTGPWLLELSAREFFDRSLTSKLAARGIVEGPNFAFGHDRKGDVRELGRMVREARDRLRGRRGDA